MIFAKSAAEQQEFNNDEISLESMALITEAAILEHASDADIDAFLNDGLETSAVEQEGILTERSIVRLDKKAKLSQMQKVAVFTIAKEKNDPLMKKLVTVWRLERSLEEKLLRKYGNEGARRAKVSMRKQGKSKSKLMQKVATTAKKQVGAL